MDINKLASISSILIGITFILWGAGIIYGLLLVSSTISAMSAIPGMGAAISSMFDPVLTFGWIFGIIAFISGILSVMTGAVYLMHKEE